MGGHTMKTAIYVTGDHEEAIERQLIACRTYTDSHMPDDEIITYRDDTTDHKVRQQLLKNASDFDSIVCYDGDQANDLVGMQNKVITVSNEVALNHTDNTLRDTFASVFENNVIGQFVGGMTEILDDKKDR